MPIYARFLPMAAAPAPDRRALPRRGRRLRPLDRRRGLLARLAQRTARCTSSRPARVDGERVATTTGFEIASLAGLDAVARRRHRARPGLPRRARAAAGRRARGAARRRGARRPDGLDLHRRLRARPRRAPRRPPRDDPLVRGRRAGEAVPADRGRPRRALRRRGRVLTSAGLSAGIDLCLHIVRADHGERVGARVARAMVAAPHRDGGQAQFIERALPAAPATARWRRSAPGRSTISPSRSTSRPSPPAPGSARAPSPAASSPRPARRRSSGCTPSACSRPAACSSTPTCRSSRSPPAAGLRLGALAARALPPRDRDHADRLPADVRGGGVRGYDATRRYPRRKHIDGERLSRHRGRRSQRRLMGAGDEERGRDGQPVRARAADRARSMRQDVTIEDGKVSGFRVRLGISFKYDKE